MPLPLKVQVGIRDHWSKEDGPLQKCLKNLHETLGHRVAIEPEWQLLLAELGDFYPDKGSFVSTLSGCVQAWVKSMSELLDDSSQEVWAEELLEKTARRSQLNLFLEAAAGDKATTTWSEQRNGFVIALPKKQIYQPAELVPLFRGDLLASFDEKKPSQIPLRAAAGAAADDWADVEMDSATGNPAVVEQPRQTSLSSAPRGASDFFPAVASLPRPDELLLRPPYHLSLMSGGSQELELECSHSPTLQFLADYLKRWCRVNHHDTRTPPAVEVKLHQSAFGLGEMYDRLTLSTRDTRYAQFRVTAPIVQSLIEGVLGYTLVSSHSGIWNYRRDVELKSM